MLHQKGAKALRQVSVARLLHSCLLYDCILTLAKPHKPTIPSCMPSVPSFPPHATTCSLGFLVSIEEREIAAPLVKDINEKIDMPDVRKDSRPPNHSLTISLFCSLSHDHTLTYIHAPDDDEEEEPERRKTCKESSGMHAKPAHLHNVPDS